MIALTTARRARAGRSPWPSAPTGRDLAGKRVGLRGPGSGGSGCDGIDAARGGLLGGVGGAVLEPAGRARRPAARRRGRASTIEGGGASVRAAPAAHVHQFVGGCRAGTSPATRRARGRSAAAPGEPRLMRLRQLRSALHAFCEEAAWQLASDAGDGAEVPFEVVEPAARRDSPLYCYRPLTGDFIRERSGALALLPSHLPAAHALIAAGRLDAYLDAQGVSRVCRPGASAPRRRCATSSRASSRTRPTSSSTSSASTPPSASSRASSATAAPRTSASRRSSASRCSPTRSRSATACRWCAATRSPRRPTRSAGTPPTAARTRSSSCAGSRSPATRRRCGEVRVAPAPPADRRCGSTTRPAIALGPLGLDAHRPAARGSRSRSAPAPARARRLRDPAPSRRTSCARSCRLIARRTPRSGELAWALRRFELAIERADPAEALTDVLLALRALLEPEGPQSGRLPGRVAALCARRPSRARRLAERVAHAVVAGARGRRGRRARRRASSALADELTGHLRALLRDVLCGHLDPDLRAVADSILAQDGARAASSRPWPENRRGAAAGPAQRW